MRHIKQYRIGLNTAKTPTASLHGGDVLLAFHRVVECLGMKVVSKVGASCFNRTYSVALLNRHNIMSHLFCNTLQWPLKPIISIQAEAVLEHL